MSTTKIYEAFRRHTSTPATLNEQFWYCGTRYVICDKCKQLTATEDCLYYGGEGYRMFSGGCRNCFSSSPSVRAS